MKEVVADEIPAGRYTYKESVGAKVIDFYWQAEVVGDDLTVSVFEENKSFINNCSLNGDTWRWLLKVEGKHDIVVKRQGDRLLISGIRHGKPYNKIAEIDERPWYQPLSFSLGNFLRSDDTAMSFWTVRADSIEPIALRVEKKGEEVIVVNTISYLAQKVEVRAEGFYSPFWLGTYWYNKSDTLFLRYRSVHGLPGTAETLVELVKIPDNL